MLFTVLLVVFIISIESEPLIIPTSLISKYSAEFNFANLLTIQLCLGTPPQCSDFIFDTASSTLYLKSLPSFSPQKFDPTKSSTYQIGNDVSYSHSHFGAVIEAIKVKDVMNLNNTSTLTKLIDWVISKEISVEWPVNANGIVGLFRKYTGEFPEEFSFVEYLYQNKIIPRKIFSHQFFKKEQGNLYLGGLPPEIQNHEYPICISDDSDPDLNDTFVRNSWHCKISEIRLNSTRNYTSGQYAIMDTGSQRIVGPEKIIKEILQYYFKLLSNNVTCTFNDIPQPARVTCGNGIINYKILPALSFRLNTTEIIIQPEDFIFEGSPSNYLLKLTYKQDINYWIFGLPLLKNYHVVFDHESNTVGFAKAITDPDTSNSVFQIVGIIIIALVLFIGIIICALKRRAKRLSLLAQQNADQAYHGLHGEE